MKQRTKNYLLITAFILVLIVAYKFSFSKTLTVKKEFEDLEMKISTGKQASVNPEALKSKESYLDSIIDKNKLKNISLQNSLLQVLNENGKKGSVKIIAFKEPHIFIKESNLKQTSFQFILEGNYKDLEDVLFLLENEYSFGSLSHISFLKKKDYKLNKDFLQCLVIIQHLE